jgi:hypothetical protein
MKISKALTTQGRDRTLRRDIYTVGSELLFYMASLGSGIGGYKKATSKRLKSLVGKTTACPKAKAAQAWGKKILAQEKAQDDAYKHAMGSVKWKKTALDSLPAALRPPVKPHKFFEAQGVKTLYTAKLGGLTAVWSTFIRNLSNKKKGYIIAKGAKPLSDFYFPKSGPYAGKIKWRLNETRNDAADGLVIRAIDPAFSAKRKALRAQKKAIKLSASEFNSIRDLLVVRVVGGKKSTGYVYTDTKGRSVYHLYVPPGQTAEQYAEDVIANSASLFGGKLYSVKLMEWENLTDSMTLRSYPYAVKSQGGSGSKSSSKAKGKYLRVKVMGGVENELSHGLDSKGRMKYQLHPPKGQTAESVAKSIIESYESGQGIFGGKLYVIRTVTAGGYEGPYYKADWK